MTASTARDFSRRAVLVVICNGDHSSYRTGLLESSNLENFELDYGSTVGLGVGWFAVLSPGIWTVLAGRTDS